MQFSVPQFIESEAKIAGPLTFRQVLYLAGAGLVIMLLYFSLAKMNFFLFIVITVLLAGIALSLAFLRIGGYSFTVFLKNFLNFFISSKVYLWERKVVSPKIVPQKKEFNKEVSEEPALKIAEKSNLRKLSTQIETMTK